DEYHNLHFLWNIHYSDAGRFAIPAPLAVDTMNSLLFLDYFPGQHFLTGLYKDLLRAGGVTHTLTRIRSAAAWLADFQRISPSKTTSSPPPELLDHQSIIEALYPLDRSSKMALSRKVEIFLSDFPPFVYTYVHDQYLLRNILYDNDRICLVDFPHLRRG